MFLVNDETENVCLKIRTKTIRAAIEEGCCLVPVFCFGNSKLFTPVGLGKNGLDTWFAKFSRKMRASVMLFYGRFFLPIPYRHPLKVVMGAAINIDKDENPSEENVNAVMQQVIFNLTELYNSPLKPSWETRPLVIQ